ncbi:MAG: tRNA 2-thiouridine(34) synthase MnmA [Desulfobacteraceae bacterium]|nr:tRNA 2-thiouridine(34) synthase MnmA [Desulfobacteraceae bacterium]
MSGGIDSLVAAHLLKEQGADLVGIHFKTGYEACGTDFSPIEERLGITVHTVDLSTVFENRVVDYFVRTYARGKTPNPCLFCNKAIKFGALMDEAEKLGAGRIATGHYVRTQRNDDGSIALVKGRDPDKEQSYFLAMLSQQQLKQAVFPLGELTKTMVRRIAEENGLVPMEKNESQDICFIQDRSFSEFIADKLQLDPRPGDITLPDHRVIGRHRGLHCYTIGQRRGLNCPGPEPYYVKTIDLATNTLVVGVKTELYTTDVVLSDLNWIAAPFTSQGKVITKIRYSHRGAPAALNISNERTTLTFDEPQFAVTPGQVAVFYQEERVLGAGIIQ